MSRSRPRALIHLYDERRRNGHFCGRGRGRRRCATTCRSSWTRCPRLLGAPATLEDAEFTLLAFCAHDESARRDDGRRPHPFDPHPRLAAVHPRLVRGVRHRLGRGAAAHPGRRGRRHPHPAGAAGPARRAHPRLPLAARRRPDRPGRRRRSRRWPRPSTSPPRPAGCSPSVPRATRTWAARWPPHSPGARSHGSRRPATSPPCSATTPPRCSWRWSPAPAGLPAGWRLPGRRRGRESSARRAPSPSSCRCRVEPICGRPGRWPSPPSSNCPRAAPPGCPPCARGWRSCRRSGPRPVPRPGWPAPSRGCPRSRTGPSWAPGGW